MDFLAVGDRLHRSAHYSRGTFPRGNRWWIAPIVWTLIVVAVIQAIWVLDRAIDHPDHGMMGYDFGLYIDATRRWLAGGTFYEAYQLAGPYDVPWGQILYPPQALALFIPFTVLPGPLFVLIPLVVTAAVIASYRPRAWAWGAMALLVILTPLNLLAWVSGTPTIWITMIVALATRWPWVGAFVWFKPSVFPLAFIGIRDRRWWIVAGAFALSCIVLWPLMVQWTTSILNARGVNSGLFYSLSPGALALPAFPIVAWAGRSSVTEE